RNKLAFKIDHELPPTNQEHDDTVDLTCIESDLQQYLHLVDGLNDVRATLPRQNTPFQTWTWKHACLNQPTDPTEPYSLEFYLDTERGMVVFAMACVCALQAEQRSSVPPLDDDTSSSSTTVKDTWRRAAGLFHEATARLPPSSPLHPFLHIWVQLCVVHAHAVEMHHVQAGLDTTSHVQIARYESALSRGGHSACVAAQSFVAHMSSPTSTTTCQQMRWLVLVYKTLCKASYCMSEVVLYESKHPDIALLFCDAVIKSKLPMPPQYPHRACVYFTKLMQTLVAAHHDSVAHAMDIKSTLQGTAKSVSWTHALRPDIPTIRRQHGQLPHYFALFKSHQQWDHLLSISILTRRLLAESE
ncbi:hypothetical protein DYB28_004189, partial [Aphanomyces astaci]